jgi:hypothetical protein
MHRARWPDSGYEMTPVGLAFRGRSKRSQAVHSLAKRSGRAAALRSLRVGIAGPAIAGTPIIVETVGIIPDGPDFDHGVANIRAVQGVAFVRGQAPAVGRVA